MNVTEITALIDALRAETARNSITPERLGRVLQDIVDMMGDSSSIKNINDGQNYRLWVGTQADLDNLDDYDEDVIYLVGVVPAVANKFNISLSLTNVSVPQGTPSKVTEGNAFSVTLSPYSGHEIDNVVVTMGGLNITSSVYNSSTGEISIASVTGAVSITASATVHITALSLSAAAQIGNTIKVTAAITPNDLAGAIYAWSIPANTTKFSLTDNQDGTATVNLLSGALTGDAVTVTCVVTNAQGTSTMSQSVAVTATSDYENVVPITNLSDVSNENGQETNTFQFSVVVTPSGGNTPPIKWSVVPTPAGAATIDEDTGLLVITANCSVVVTATSGEHSASQTVTGLTYSPTGHIQFKDPYAEAMIKSLVQNPPAEITYENAAGLTRYSGASVASTYKKGGATPVRYLPERYLFTNLTSGDNTELRSQITAVREMSANESISNTTYPITGLTYLTKLEIMSGFTIKTDGSGGVIKNCPALQVLDFRKCTTTSITNNRLFDGCTRLKTVRFPSTLTSFGATVVQMVRSGVLEYVEFNSPNIDKVNINPYQGTKNVSLIFTSETLVPLTLANMEVGVSRNKLNLVYVPDALVDSYRTQWPGISAKIKGISELPSDWDKTIFPIQAQYDSNAKTTLTTIAADGSLSTTIEPQSGYTLAMATVTMCGEDITSTALNTSTGALTIQKVEGDVLVKFVTPES